MDLFVLVPIFIAFVWIFIITVFLTTLSKTRKQNAARARPSKYVNYRSQFNEDRYHVDDAMRDSEASGYFANNNPQRSTEGVGDAPLHVVQPSFESGHYHAETSITGIQNDHPPREAVIHRKSDAKKAGTQKTQQNQEPEKKQTPPHHSRYRDAVVFGELLRPKYF